MKYKDEKKIEAIFDATLKLTSTVGIAGLKMSQIAKEAQIASGTLYIYFESKEELLNSLYSHLIAQGTLRKIPQLSKLPVKEQLAKLWESTLTFRVDNHSKIVFLEQFLVSPFISKEAKKQTRQFTDHIKKLMDKGKEEGLIKNMKSSILFACLAGSVREFAIEKVRKNKRANKKYIEQTFNLVWDAIKKSA